MFGFYFPNNPRIPPSESADGLSEALPLRTETGFDAFTKLPGPVFGLFHGEVSGSSRLYVLASREFILIVLYAFILRLLS